MWRGEIPAQKGSGRAELLFHVAKAAHLTKGGRRSNESLGEKDHDENNQRHGNHQLDERKTLSPTHSSQTSQGWTGMGV